MFKFVLVFVLGLGLGYAYGYREAAAERPSVMQKVMERFGVYKVQDRQQRREQATEAVR